MSATNLIFFKEFKNCPLGSTLGLMLLSIFRNDVGRRRIPLYASDAVICIDAPSIIKVVRELQTAEIFSKTRSFHDLV